MEKATFGAGCFWGGEYSAKSLASSTRSAAMPGAHSPIPTYKQVCSDTTGHAEVVQVTYDPAKASYDRLLDVWPCLRRIGNIAIGRRRADQARTSPNTWKRLLWRLPGHPSRQEERRLLGCERDAQGWRG